MVIYVNYFNYVINFSARQINYYIAGSSAWSGCATSQGPPPTKDTLFCLSEGRGGGNRTGEKVLGHLPPYSNWISNYVNPALNWYLHLTYRHHRHHRHHHYHHRHRRHRRHRHHRHHRHRRCRRRHHNSNWLNFKLPTAFLLYQIIRLNLSQIIIQLACLQAPVDLEITCYRSTRSPWLPGTPVVANAVTRGMPLSPVGKYFATKQIIGLFSHK